MKILFKTEMRMVAIKKILIIFLPVLVCAVALIFWWNTPRNIDIECKGLQYEMGTKTSEEVNIKISGKLYNNNVFKGKISIDKIDFTKKYDMLPITFDKDIMNGAGTLAYTTVIDGKPILEMVGTIRTDDNFNKVYININNKENKSAIAAPSSNIEEFNNIKKELEN